MASDFYQRYELEAYIGSENLNDFDVDAIEAEATEIDYASGNRVWIDDIDLAEICARHDMTNKKAAEVEDEIYDGYFDIKKIDYNREYTFHFGVAKMTKDKLIRKAAEITNMQWSVYKSYESIIGPSDTHETTFRMMMKWGAYIQGFSELFGLDGLQFMDICRRVRHEAENDRR